MLTAHKGTLTYSNGLRAMLCMAPMMLAALTGNVAYVVPFGQGGFFNSTIPLAKTNLERIISGFLMLAPGLGLYLIGGNTAESVWLAVIYALVVGFTCCLLSSFRYLGMVAIGGFMPIYTAGLNAGNPEKAGASFVAFSIVILYCGFISLLPFWKSVAMPIKKMAEQDRVIMGLRLGIGSAVALGIGLVFNFGKLGWAPSAVSSVVRTDMDQAKLNSWIRALSVVGGAVIAGIAFTFISSLLMAASVAFLLAILNGLLSNTRIGRAPLLYNAVILILYSQTAASSAKFLLDTRILYNLIGITIALTIVYYPMPYLTRKVKEFYAHLSTTDAV